MYNIGALIRLKKSQKYHAPSRPKVNPLNFHPEEATKIHEMG